MNKKYDSRPRWMRFPWIKITNYLPRLRLHEKHQAKVKWALRLLTMIGIVTSVISFEPLVALLVSIGFVAVDYFIESTNFFYTSMFVQDMILDYDPEAWVATIVVSIGKPEKPESKKILGIWLADQEYAEKFFAVLHNWTRRDDGRQGNLRVSFIIDEDAYFVYLYCDPSTDSRFEAFRDEVEDENQLPKYGKEHFALLAQQILCRGFPTTKGFGVGMLVNYPKPDDAVLLAPYITGPDGKPIPAERIKPIALDEYKVKIPSELDESDLEMAHWNKLVAPERDGTDFEGAKDSIFFEGNMPANDPDR